MKYICKYIENNRIVETNKEPYNGALKNFKSGAKFLFSFHLETKSIGQRVNIFLTQPKDIYKNDDIVQRLLDLGVFSHFDFFFIFPIIASGKNLHDLMKKYDPKGNYQKINNDEIIKAMYISKCHNILLWDKKYNKDAKWLIPVIEKYGICAFDLDKDGYVNFKNRQADNEALLFRIEPIDTGEEFIFQRFKAGEKYENV